MMGSKRNNWITLILVILAIVVLLLTLGIFSGSKDKKELDRKKSIQKRLREIEDWIKVLEPQVQKLKRRERRILLWVRIVIASFLVGTNVVYLYCDDWKFDLGDQLNFNGAILLLYSFVAYILYGSLERFTRIMKLKVQKISSGKKVHLYTELLLLKNQKELLKTELRSL